MLAKIFIKRKFKAGYEKEIVTLLNALRAQALQQPGYVTGMTLISPDNPLQSLVIGTWKRLELWHNWRNNTERKDFEAMLDIYQERPTQYEEYILGTPFEQT